MEKNLKIFQMKSKAYYDYLTKTIAAFRDSIQCECLVLSLYLSRRKYDLFILRVLLKANYWPFDMKKKYNFCQES